MMAKSKDIMVLQEVKYVTFDKYHNDGLSHPPIGQNLATIQTFCQGISFVIFTSDCHVIVAISFDVMKKKPPPYSPTTDNFVVLKVLVVLTRMV